MKRGREGAPGDSVFFGGWYKFTHLWHFEINRNYVDIRKIINFVV